MKISTAIKTLCLASMLPTLAVAATASAAAPEFLLDKTPTKFTGKSGAGTLETVSGFKITCSSDEVLAGEITANDSKEGKIGDIHFKGCKTGGLAIHSEGGDTGETILTGSATVKLCFIKNGTPLEVGALITFKEIKILTAGGVKITLAAGSLVGKLTPLNELTAKLTLDFKVEKGKPIIKCEGSTDQLLAKTPLSGEKFEEGALAGSEALETAATETVTIDG